MQQLTLFDCLYPQFKITKPVRLIECFAGYGSQALALKYMGIKFEHWKICEWAINSIQAYKDIHFFNDATDYSLSLSLLEIINYLENKGISKDYNNPMQRKEIERLGENKCRKIYNNIISTHNLVNITQVKGKDLNIVDTDQYQYILTYSFPCQDLSLAGLQKGMTKGSETRSGLLWEVERILDELSLDNIELPILLMENVPQIHSQQNIADFKKWLLKLEKLGYTNFCENVNSKNYGIPQNRVRTFCLSIPRKEIAYSFLPKIKLKNYLFDLLEPNVDEKYFLSKKQIKDIINWNAYQKPFETMERLVDSGIAPTITTRSGEYTAGMILTPTVLGGFGKKVNNERQYHQQNRIYDNKITISLTTSFAPLYLSELGIRKLTPREYFRLMGVKDEDFEKVKTHQTESSLYHLAGDSIVTTSLIAVLGNLFKNINLNEILLAIQKDI